MKEAQTDKGALKKEINAYQTGDKKTKHLKDVEKKGRSNKATKKRIMTSGAAKGKGTNAKHYKSATTPCMEIS